MSAYARSGRRAGVGGVVWEASTRYRPGGAEQALSELKAAMATCTREGGSTYVVEANSFAGDDSLLIRESFDVKSGSQTPVASSRYRALNQAGNVVMALTINPHENGMVARGTADMVIDLAIKKAER